MRINLTQTQKISDTLRTVAADARRYMILDADELGYYAMKAEEIAASLKLKRSELKGLKVSVLSASSSSSAARKTACSSLVLERGAAGWFLVSCEKKYREPKKSELFEVIATEEQKEASVSRCFPRYRM